MRDNGLKDCKVHNFNMGMTNRCLWDNNCATPLGGKTIVYNMKRIQTSKTAKKQIRFYYVLPAGKLAPMVPTEQCFYQSLWDDPERRNCSLKRKAKKIKDIVQKGPAITSKHAHNQSSPRIVGAITTACTRTSLRQDVSSRYWI
jgi:hypothetical protein